MSEATTQPRWTKRGKASFIWCDHCNCQVGKNQVSGCLRKTCQTKQYLDMGVKHG